MSKEKSPKETTGKRYNLVLPERLYNEVGKIAAKHGTSVTEIIRRCIKLGLLLEESSPKTQFIVKDVKTGTEKQIILL